MLFTVIAFAIIATARTTQNFCKKISSREIGDAEGFFSYAGFYMLVAAVCAFVSLCFIGFDGLDAKTVVCAFVSAIMYAIDLYTGLETIKHCTLVTATMFTLGGSAVCCAVSYFWFAEPLSLLQIFGLLFFFLGVYLLSASDEKSEQKTDARTIVLLFLNLFANGLILVAQKYFAYRAENGNVMLFSFLIFLFSAAGFYVMYFILRFAKRKQRDGERQKMSKSLLLSGVVLAVGLFFVNYLMTELGKTISSVILYPTSNAISIGMTTLVGWLVYRERLTKKNAAGLILGFFAIVVIGVCTPEFLSRIF